MPDVQEPSHSKPVRPRLHRSSSLDAVRPLRVHQPAEPTDEPAAGAPPTLETTVAEVVAAPAGNDTPPPPPADSAAKPDKLPKKPWSKRRKWLTWSTVALVLILVGGGLAWAYTRPVHKVPIAKATPTPATPTPTPTIVADPLTGLMVAPSAAQQPVAGVMIENFDPDARPQSGLSQAGVVYEALAEGGITRFLAIFQEPFPAVIGPVRSLRPYYLTWGLEYNIPVAHAGGSQPALADVGPSGLKDINALAYDGSYFYRTTDRLAPHNLYTNASLLAQLDTKLGFASAPSFTPLPRKTDAPAATPPHPTINISFSYAGYNVEYKYDATTDSYARFLAGTAHVDRNTNQQIMVKNIIVEYVPTTYSTQPDGEPETDMNLIGTGNALVFDDGNVTAATWSKTSQSTQTKILGANGKPIAVNRGNTWYEILPTGNSVTY